MVDRNERAEPKEGVLEPDELEVEGREEVEPIGENRYVVSTDGESEGGKGSGSSQSDRAESKTEQAPAPEPTSPPSSPDPGTSTGPSTPLAAVGERYAVDVAAKVDGGVADVRIGSDSIVETFEEMLLWYASQVDDSTPPEEVIRILLAESDLDVSLLD